MFTTNANKSNIFCITPIDTNVSHYNDIDPTPRALHKQHLESQITRQNNGKKQCFILYRMVSSPHFPCLAYRSKYNEMDSTCHKVIRTAMADRMVFSSQDEYDLLHCTAINSFICSLLQGFCSAWWVFFLPFEGFHDIFVQITGFLEK